MLAILAFQIMITCFCLGTGLLWYRLQGILSGRRQNGEATIPLVGYLFTGLISITCIAQLANIWFPLNNTVFLACTALLVLALLLQRQHCIALLKHAFDQLRNLNIAAVVAIVAFEWMLLNQASGPVIMDDTESYHMQLLLWNQSYPVIPGLANLHERFGFQSAFFSTAAFFYRAPYSLNFYAALNSTLSAWFAVYCITLIVRNDRNREPVLFRSAVLLLLLLFIYAWPVLRGGSANLNYDLVCTLAVTVFVIEQLRACWKGGATVSPEWILWPAFLFSVRIMFFPFLLLAGAALWKGIRSNIRSLILPAGMGLLLAGGLLYRNYITSGYLFYPSILPDLFSPDWKLPTATVERLLDFIRYYNRVPDHMQEIAVTRTLGETGWVSTWFHFLSLTDKLLVLLSIAGIICSFMLITRLDNRPTRGILLLVWTSLTLSLIAWFAIAPDPRFAYASLGVLSTTAIAWLGTRLPSGFPVILNRYGPAGIAVILLAYTGHKSLSNPDYRNLLLPVAIPSPPLRVIHVDGMPFNIPSPILNNWNARCYCSPLPCLYEIKPGLAPRTGSLSGGFKIKID